MLPVTARVAMARAAILVVIDMGHSIRFERGPFWSACPLDGANPNPVRSLAPEKSRSTICQIRQLLERCLGTGVKPAHVEIIDFDEQFAERMRAVVDEAQTLFRC